MKENTTCKLCDSPKLWTIKTYHITADNNQAWRQVFESMADVPQPLLIRLSLCRRCGFLFYRDTFSLAEMKQFYEAEARYTRPKEHQLKPGRLWEMNQMLTVLKKYLTAGKVKTALDLGAGDFVTLERIRELNRSVVYEALDPSYPKASHNGITVYRTMIEDFEPSKTYDFVSAIHILEHVDEVSRFMRKAYELVRPNGYFYGEVPFQVGPGLLLNRSASVQHVNYFTPQTFAFLIQRSGFKIKTVVFDTDSYRHNGMPGMIRVLAQKSNSEASVPKPTITLGYLINPTLVIQSRMKRTT